MELEKYRQLLLDNSTLTEEQKQRVKKSFIEGTYQDACSLEELLIIYNGSCYLTDDLTTEIKFCPKLMSYISERKKMIEVGKKLADEAGLSTQQKENIVNMLKSNSCSYDTRSMTKKELTIVRDSSLEIYGKVNSRLIKLIEEKERQ